MVKAILLSMLAVVLAFLLTVLVLLVRVQRRR